MFPSSYFPRSYFQRAYFPGGAPTGALPLPVVATVTALEMELSGKGNGWTWVKDILVGIGVRWHRGFTGAGVGDRLEEVGALSFTLSNGPQNSVGLTGYYSPDHVNKRPGFDLGIGVRYRINDNVRFTGILNSIQVVPGSYGPRTTACEAVGWMDTAARERLSNLPVLMNKRGDEVFQTLIDSIPLASQPLAIEKDLSADIFPYTLDHTRDEQTVLRDELFRLTSSGMDRVWTRGNGTVVYESRTRRPAVVSDTDIYTDSNGFVAAHDRDNGLINRVQCTVHPRLPSSVSVVMYSLNQPMALIPGVTTVVLAPWTDPNNPDVRVGAVSLDTVVPTIDYLVNSLQDGTGADLTLSLTVVTGLSGNATEFTLTLAGSETGWLTKLQQRGKPLFDYGPTVTSWDDSVSQGKYGLAADAVDMSYQADLRFGLEVAQYFVYLMAYPVTQISGLVRIVDLSRDSIELRRSIDREISDRVRLIDPVTGLNRSFFINSISETAIENTLTTEFSFGPADSTAFWQLGVAGASELDVSTVLGFGLIVGHADTEHQDTHTDVAFVDVAHSDTHTDNSHQDMVHQDAVHSDAGTHGDVVHTDLAHLDSLHSDLTHNDISHLDAHYDTPHSDTAHSDSHSDVAHDDVAHSDSHNDDHDDIPAHFDSGAHEFHEDVHFDTHGDSHGDSGHSDVHNDTVHADVAFVDDHYDRAHNDRAHGDTSHADTAHGDVAAHTDGVHSDVVHQDVSHADSVHGDVAHTDTPHSDVVHDDLHEDIEHGDAN